MPELAGEEHAEIAGSAEEVWAYRLTFTNLPEYNPSVTAISRISEGEGIGGAEGIGAQYEFTLATPIGPHQVILTVDHLEAHRMVRASMQSGMAAAETFTVEPISPDRCSASLSLWLEVPTDVPHAAKTQMLDSGRSQIRSELDEMQAVFLRRAARSCGGES